MDNTIDLKNSMECENICEGVKVPSEDEIIACNAMRKIKERVRVVKSNLSELSAYNSMNNKKQDLEKEIAGLREKWNEWEKKREKAAKERMILLGHEER